MFMTSSNKNKIKNDKKSKSLLSFIYTFNYLFVASVSVRPSVTRDEQSSEKPITNHKVKSVILLNSHLVIRGQLPFYFSQTSSKNDSYYQVVLFCWSAFKLVKYEYTHGNIYSRRSIYLFIY